MTKAQGVTPPRLEAVRQREVVVVVHRCASVDDVENAGASGCRGVVEGADADLVLPRGDVGHVDVVVSLCEERTPAEAKGAVAGTRLVFR